MFSIAFLLTLLLAFFFFLIHCFTALMVKQAYSKLEKKLQVYFTHTLSAKNYLFLCTC